MNKNITEKIDKKLIWLKNIRPLEKDIIQKIQDRFLVEYNYHSNHLEGNSLTLQETWALLKTQLITTDKNKKFRDFAEMNGHNKAVKYLRLTDKLFYTENFIKSENLIISDKLIKELNQIILIEDYKKQVRDEFGNIHFVDVIVGQYKAKENHVQRLSDGSIFKFASVIETPIFINELIKWFENNKNKYHPLILASIFHYKFIRIHPFDDGNGRVARLLTNMILMNFGYPITIISSNREDRQEYYNALELTDANLININEVFEPNNLEKYNYFIEFMGKRLLNSFEIIENEINF